nr:hypothetical protein [Mesorhizobium sp.]
MSTLLATIRGAMLADNEPDLPEAGATGASAPNTQESGMSGSQTPAGVPQADHDAAVTAAETRGKAAGVQAATERLSAALGADGVKGDGVRMAAGLDLAVKSPGMSGADVAAFIVANVAASKLAADADAYDARRVAGAGQAQPQGDKKPAGAGVTWSDFRAKRGK